MNVEVLTPLIDAVEVLEVTLNASEKVYSFGENQKIRDRVILGIVVYASGLSQKGATLADPSNAYLTLRDEGGQDAQFITIPLRSLIYTPGNPIQQTLRLGGRTFNWGQSTVSFANTPTTGQVLQLVVFYKRLGK